MSDQPMRAPRGICSHFSRPEPAGRGDVEREERRTGGCGGAAIKVPGDRAAVHGVDRFLARWQRCSPKSEARPQSGRADGQAHWERVDAVVTPALRLAHDRSRVARHPVPTNSSRLTSKKSCPASMSSLTSEAEKASTVRSAATNVGSVPPTPLAVFGERSREKRHRPPSTPVSLRACPMDRNGYPPTASGDRSLVTSPSSSYAFNGRPLCSGARRRSILWSVPPPAGVETP